MDRIFDYSPFSIFLRIFLSSLFFRKFKCDYCVKVNIKLSRPLITINFLERSFLRRYNALTFSRSRCGFLHLLGPVPRPTPCCCLRTLGQESQQDSHRSLSYSHLRLWRALLPVDDHQPAVISHHVPQV